MQTDHPQIFNSADLTSLLQKGLAGLFPTDTLPALGSLPSHASQLWRIKRRPFEKPFILMGANSEDLLEFVSPCAFDDAWKVARRYWPGALTLVVPSPSEVVAHLNKESNSIGIRVPASKLTRDLLEKSGPLATTSANLTGQNPALTPEEASRYFPDLPLLGPIPWPAACGTASTVISWEGLGEWRLLRRGSVSPELGEWL